MSAYAYALVRTSLRADLHGTTLAHATSLRQAHNMTCVTRNATRAGSEEGRLSSQGMKLLVVDYLLCLPSPDSLPFEIKNVVMTTLKRRFFLSPIFTHSLLFAFFLLSTSFCYFFV